MSVDIDWSLLSDPAASALADGLITALNNQLNTASRPSFLGPVTVSSFDFGTSGPDVEIKDVRDVWLAFEDGDDEGDAEADAAAARAWSDGEERDATRYTHSPYAGHVQSHHGHGHAHSHSLSYSHTANASLSPQPLGRDPHSHHFEAPTPQYARFRPALDASRPPSAPLFAGPHAHGHELNLSEGDDEADSVYSGTFPSRPQSVVSVGIGVELASGMALGRSRARGIGPQLISTPPRVPGTPGAMSVGLTGLSGLAAGAWAQSQPRFLGGVAYSASAHNPELQSLHLPSSPPSQPARPTGPEMKPKNSVPSVQLHLRLDHAANLSLTLNTSLQVNYPSALFMALPLKLVITGMTLAADIVVAYSSQKHRVHLCIVDAEDGTASSGGGNPSHATWNGQIGGGGIGRESDPIGQRILPHLHIESEIGHSDAHVLRNVGKVERFIVDVIRKTLVDELVFPNFHSIAL